MEIVCAQEEAKQKKPHIVYRNPSSTHAASKPIKADVIRLSNQLPEGVPYEMLVPQDEGVLQSGNCHFIRGLCAPVVSLCGSVGW